MYPASAFAYDPDARTCICPAGKRMNRNGRRAIIRDNIWERFQGKPRDCLACSLRTRCIAIPETTTVRSVMFFQGKTAPLPETHTARMKRRIDAPEGRRRSARRFATVEPVFGNRCANKGLDRFTRRGRAKVDGQWKRFCLVQNIEKLARHGYGR